MEGMAPTTGATPGIPEAGAATPATRAEIGAPEIPGTKVLIRRRLIPKTPILEIMDTKIVIQDPTKVEEDEPIHLIAMAEGPVDPR